MPFRLALDTPAIFEPHHTGHQHTDRHAGPQTSSPGRPPLNLSRAGERAPRWCAVGAALLRDGREAKVRAELSMATPLVPPAQPVGHGEAVDRGGLPGINGMCPATSTTSAGRGAPVFSGASAVNPHLLAGIARSSSPSSSDVAAGATEKMSA